MSICIPILYIVPNVFSFQRKWVLKYLCLSLGGEKRHCPSRNEVSVLSRYILTFLSSRRCLNNESVVAVSICVRMLWWQSQKISRHIALWFSSINWKGKTKYLKSYSFDNLSTIISCVKPSSRSKWSYIKMTIFSSNPNSLWTCYKTGIFSTLYTTQSFFSTTQNNVHYSILTTAKFVLNFIWSSDSLSCLIRYFH